MPDILRVQDLKTVFHVKAGEAKVVNGFSLRVKEGELLGLVGESGSGKTVTAMSIMGKVKKPGEILGGRVFYHDSDLRDLGEDEMHRFRGREIAIIAANARGHLNPLLRVGQQIANVHRAHYPEVSKKGAMRKSVAMLKSVGINDAEMRAKAYPHELSGGMAQRVMIAMALINSPRLLIADDATNGLDVTVQAQIMELITTMIRREGMSGIFITHDLGVVAQCCNSIAIIYSGQVVEQCSVREFFAGPRHPYSEKLLDSIPERHQAGSVKTAESGAKPSPLHLPAGCLYHPRCPRAMPQCSRVEPGMVALEGERRVKCHLYGSAEQDEKAEKSA
ncbi:MAG: ABC transporter ATP-binding protein [Planctomycetes bacterium]|nr:ABC transporter ATP-binding protein [Planctomycetota bacterium]